jgi:NADPH:quinone reductase-like Zn-dependent oxidoreductase
VLYREVNIKTKFNLKAFVFHGNQQVSKIEEVSKPKLVKDQFLIQLKYAALNHHDLWVLREK